MIFSTSIKASIEVTSEYISIKNSIEAFSVIYLLTSQKKYNILVLL